MSVYAPTENPYEVEKASLYMKLEDIYNKITK